MNGHAFLYPKSSEFPPRSKMPSLQQSQQGRTETAPSPPIISELNCNHFLLDHSDTAFCFLHASQTHQTVLHLHVCASSACNCFMLDTIQDSAQQPPYPKGHVWILNLKYLPHVSYSLPLEPALLDPYKGLAFYPWIVHEFIYFPCHWKISSIRKDS